MIVAFLGHRNLVKSKELYEEIKNAILSNTRNDETTKFYCGGYGNFDDLCASVCRSIKERLDAEIVYVTPYISENEQKKIDSLIKLKLYDYSLYPPIEATPPKFAISKRNEWIVDKADLIIAYVSHNYGGAYRSLLYAKRKNKRIINLYRD